MRRVIAARQGKNGSPDLAVYFCGREYPPTEEDLKQSQQVLQFKNEIVRDNLLVYREYETIEKFGHLVTNRLADYLDSWLLQNRLAPTIVCWPDKEPAFIRVEGFAEPIGDIRLHVSGHSLADSRITLAVEIRTSSNITSGLSEDGNCQTYLTLNSTPDAPMALGALGGAIVGATNVLRFKPVSIDSTDGIVREMLVIRDLRVNSPPLESPILGCTSVQCQITVRDGSHDGTLLFQGNMTVATVVRGVRFDAGPLISANSGKTHQRLFAIARFSCPTGCPPDTLLVATLRDHADEFDIYFTGHDLSFGKELPQGGFGEGNASAVPTDLRGHRVKGKLGPPFVDYWEGRIPMYKLNGDSVAWQPKKSVDHYEFVLVLIPRHTTYSRVPQISGGLGPYILGTDSANTWGQAQRVSAETLHIENRAYLPLPRFRGQSPFIDLL